jgi:hypothetical protein
MLPNLGSQGDSGRKRGKPSNLRDWGMSPFHRAAEDKLLDHEVTRCCVYIRYVIQKDIFKVRGGWRW